MRKFRDSVVNVVRMIPKGKVASYGQVALYIGSPRAARQVGWVLSGLDDTAQVHWWRVVNNRGLITIKGSKFDKNEQRRLLQAEGVVVNANYELDMIKYRFNPDKKFIKALELEEEYLSYLTDKLGV